MNRRVKCFICGRESSLISSTLGICVECIRRDFKKIKNFIEKAHQKTRKEFDLPLNPPQDKRGISCHLCMNNCKIPSGEKSFCGLRKNEEGRLKGPYTLLGFYPQFYMHDLPPTSREHARRCLEVARKEGLKRVRVGNAHLLGNDYKD